MTLTNSVLPGRARASDWLDEDSTWELSLGLAGYLRAVAKRIGVPAEGTTFEISDTATAYLALTRRSPAWPARDLMLVWSERTGWIVSVETEPHEAPVVIACFGGTDPLPAPDAVARFVAEALTGDGAAVARVTTRIDTNRVRLAKDLAHYI
ncbi:DUF6292 domain-containing protein [Kibdelosporangium persicum]|uniref:DUF6292 domain-containing protein n=1 Tax=Kibdelosporangium persicum TaxID=2698649 RepID=A0ABX2F6M1_9PSEU|nr:DUF6292 family protein [Kibdelosporangium persicum]NRN67000.1 hypothetical protein [Kibdelosporangium persicum]